ncbi:MAG: DUF1223 domain-containing protein [Caldimonas sp.]
MKPFLRRTSSLRHAPGLALSMVVAGLGFGQGLARAAEACTAASPRQVAPVVELYTSEGCNSCPPADRWLSKLKSDPTVVALAFHVDYWDRLGWKDRFASAAFTARQAAQQASNGARFSYTPQVVVDGRDRTDWSRAAVPAPTRQAALVDVVLAHQGERFVATVTPAPGSPERLAAYWAVTEQGHVTAVKAGENDGSTLHHDFVVRDYETVPAWAARGGAATLRFKPATAPDAAHPRSINLVVVDAATGRPVQAVKIGC